MSDHAEDDQCRYDLSERMASHDSSVHSIRRSAVTYGIESDSYELYSDQIHTSHDIVSPNSLPSNQMGSQSFRLSSNSSSGGRSTHSHQVYQRHTSTSRRIFSDSATASPNSAHRQDPYHYISPEILAVRKSALTVHEPLTYIWLIFSVGFSLSAGLGMAKWNGLLTGIPYWFIFSPCWLSHGVLLLYHILAMRALATFISVANNNRQRSGSNDNNDRTEYLPLLQRSLKFGIKTGSFSMALFVFEILLFFYITQSKLKLAMVFLPLFVLSTGGILYGITCKTQHFTMIITWVLFTIFMTLTILKVDSGVYSLTWGMVFSPLILFVCMSITSLIYIIHGNHIRYFTLTMAQYKAGILYSASSICGMILILLLMSKNFAQPGTVGMQFFMVVLTCITVTLLSLGAYAVSRDELERLFKNGGQSVVRPKKLRFELLGWNAVDSKGVMMLPMFGEVGYEPLDLRSRGGYYELCSCCTTCYPHEDDDDLPIHP